MAAVKLLAIETSTEACSAAVHDDGRICARAEIAPQRHAELILLMCEAVLAEAGLRLQDLDGLGFGRGPGAFTGVRIAAGVIQGIALGTGLKVAAVSSLAALAQGVVRTRAASQVLAGMDARMGEIYIAAYAAHRGEATAVSAEAIGRAADVTLPQDGRWSGAGSAFAVYGEVLGARLGDHLAAIYPQTYPLAQDAATLAVGMFARGEAVEAELALPVYLRDRVVDAAAMPP
ncbi:MAG: tRNA threonylcarbamoyladenosine biosynthesis protein TsaB [Gammaproteobacteria bacterium]|nr:tRNA threonylcarbamoyladenosine biosynthesis protein TsaB [Gammaproteobacteria bacterium]